MLKMKFVPYEKLKGNYKTILKDLKEGSIIVVDAKLSAAEEADLIQETMRVISKRFAGIELGSVDFAHMDLKGSGKLKNFLIERISGKKRGMTIIGPAKIVQKIKKNPEELMLYV